MCRRRRALSPARLARSLLAGLVAFGYGYASVYPWLTHPDQPEPPRH